MASKDLTPASRPAPPPGAMTAEQVRQAVADRPLLACPAPLRQAVWKVWVCHQHLFPSVLPLAGAVGVWVREHGLREADAAAVLRGMLAPGRMAGYRFASDLLTDLAGLARGAVELRREEERKAREAAGQAAADRRPRATAEQMEAFRAVAESFGKMPE